jgi:hypothetical protein
VKTPHPLYEKVVQMLKAGIRPYYIRQQIPQARKLPIAYWRKQLGLPPFSRGALPGMGRNLAARRKAEKLRAKGWTYAKIGAALGVSRQRVHQYLSPAYRRNPPKRK